MTEQDTYIIAKDLAKPGIYHNVPFDVYLKIPAVSRSYLCKLLGVPANAKVPIKDTTALLIGRALHKYVLEGEDAFHQHYVIGPDIKFTSPANKAKWAKFEMENEGKYCIRPKDIKMEEIIAIRQAIINHPGANDLLKDGLSEETIVWRDEETGILCKARPDKYPSTTEFVIVDYKSTGDASEKGFLSSVVKFHYYIQDAMYSEGIKTLTGKDFLFAFVAVEKKEPYRTEVWTLHEDLRRIGSSEFHRLLRIERQCRKANFWPHYENRGAAELICPKWLKDRHPEIFPEVHP